MTTVEELKQALEKTNRELNLAKAVVETSRDIKRKYPGGKFLWFEEFSAFEAALSAYDMLVTQEERV